MSPSVTAKLANMRKPQRFWPQRDQNQVYMVQSDKSIGRFDGQGRGILNTTGAYFMHLSHFMGAKAYQFPAEFVQECQEIFIRPGEKIGELDGSPVIFGGLTTIKGDVNDPESPKNTDIARTFYTLDNLFSTHNKVVIENGTILWDMKEKVYRPYDGSALLGRWQRRNLEDLMAYFKEQLGD